MVFSSISFLFYFLPLILALYYLPALFWAGLRHFSGKAGGGAGLRAYQNLVLLLSSLFFYAWGEPVYVLLLLFSIFANWAAGLLIGRFPDKPFFFWAGIVLNLLLLFFFKYLGFAAAALGRVFHREIRLSIALPIGISFYTFQGMSYLIDLYRGNASVQRSLPRLALYISMFPQLIAGPIVRYQSIEAEIGQRQENLPDFSAGLLRFVYGLSKKVLLANNLGILSDKAFSAAGLSVGSAWLGIAAYTLQIFFDFSGYSDMAIGLGAMFGFHFAENFSSPYLARSVTAFWRRWHISLSAWFRDYVYIPLGGKRRGWKRHILNLFTVWALTGIWHGANWTFLAWGLLYFLILLLEKYGRKIGADGGNAAKSQAAAGVLPRTGRGAAMVRGIFSRFYTLFLVSMCWVLFRADDLPSALSYWACLFGLGGRSRGLWDPVASYWFSSYKGFLFLGILACLPFQDFFQRYAARRNGRSVLLTVLALCEPIYALLLLLLCIAFLLSDAYNPFIYFNF